LTRENPKLDRYSRHHGHPYVFRFLALAFDFVEQVEQVAHDLES
jgi:hypothetical protein